MNFIESKYIEQINNLQKELAILKLQESKISKAVNLKEYSDGSSGTLEGAAETVADTSLDLLKGYLTAAGIHRALSGEKVKPEELSSLRATPIIRHNIQDFMSNLVAAPLMGVGSKLAAAIINAAGRNPLDFAKAVELTRYNPYAIASPDEERRKTVAPQNPQQTQQTGPTP
jgi:hypothetical protein